MRNSLKGKLDISGSTSGRMEDGRECRDFVFIKLIDEASFCHVIEIMVDKRSFADALFGHAHMECEFALRKDCPVGKQREVKHVNVFVPGKSYDKKSVRAKKVREAVAAFEVDGWKGRDEDANNSHNRIGPPLDNGDQWRVTFIRFVDKTNQPLGG